MANDPKNLAERLQQFIAAAKNVQGGRLPSGMTARPGPVKSVIEECVDELSPDERDALHHIIEKMRASPALASPRGAIVLP